MRYHEHRAAITDISCLGVLDKDGPMPAGRRATEILTRHTGALRNGDDPPALTGPPCGHVLGCNLTGPARVSLAWTSLRDERSPGRETTAGR